MTPQAMVVLTSIIGILMQFAAGAIVVKVAVAVLEEKFRSFREVAEERHKGTESELVRLRDWRYEVVTPAMQKVDYRLSAHDQALGEHRERIALIERSREG